MIFFCFLKHYARAPTADQRSSLIVFIHFFESKTKKQTNKQVQRGLFFLERNGKIAAHYMDVNMEQEERKSQNPVRAVDCQC